MMELLKDVAHISGKPGLYKIVKPGRAGVIVESLNSQKKREMINAASKVSILHEIAIYTEYIQDEGDSKPLIEIFAAIKETYGEKIDINPKTASNEELFDFIGSVLPEYDKEKVYANDVKKIINWYNIVSDFFPEALEESAEEKE